MAGEWIAYDLALPAKPEVQELIDETGHPVEVVVYRLLQLWGWASMHCHDGVARMTLPRLVRTCGGDDAFWLAVAAVGWLEIDETAATVAVPGWDRRFSQAAKSRAQARDREKAYDERSGRPPARERGKPPAPARGDDPAPLRGRGEEIEEKRSPPPPRDAVQSRKAWATLRAAWAAGPGRPWTPPEPPDGLADRLAEDGWLEEAVEAIGRLKACRFFKTPPTLIQFVKAGFVRRVLGGQYDEPRAERPAGGPAEAPKRQLPADFTAAVRATQAALEAKRREAS
jgi:hypothetical protein